MHARRRPLPHPLTDLDLYKLADTLRQAPHMSDTARAVTLADAVRTAASKQRELRTRPHKRR
ncbi:MAG: hypothetical protein KBD24_03920 [Candidatus Pacebacteria bacterium]|nr:hypothetical protein [Candidatus Paceibacterota bacterium]